MKRKLISVLLCAAMVSTMLAGCGNKKEAKSESNEGTAKTEAGGEADAGNVADTLIFGQSADPRGMDPALVDDSLSSKINCQIYEGLLQYAKDSTDIEPCLAKEWEISEDQLSYTFKLQEGVKFQDGTDFNAEAVKFNVDRQTVNKTEDMAYASFVYGPVKDCEVVDEYTVKINLKEVCTPFLNNLAMSVSAPMMSPAACEKYNNNLNENPVGTGPYKFVRWDKEEAVVLERYEEYWGDKGKSKNIIFKTIPDNSARVVALTNGEVDIIDDIDANVVDQVTQSGAKIFQAEGMNLNYMAYNMQKMTDPEVRKALSQAVNVPELVESLYKGYADTATSILPTFMPGYSADVKQTQYDPEAAKATLAAKGVTELHFMTYTNARPYNTATGQTLAEAIQGYLDKVGVKATIDSYDWTTYKEKLSAGNYDACFYGWTGDNGDADNFMNLLAEPDPTMNVALYQNEEFNAKLKEAASTPNGDERNAKYKELEQMVADQNVWLPISHGKTLSGYLSNVQNYSFHQTGNVFLSQTYKAE